MKHVVGLDQPVGFQKLTDDSHNLLPQHLKVFCNEELKRHNLSPITWSHPVEGGFIHKTVSIGTLPMLGRIPWATKNVITLTRLEVAS